MGRKHWEIKPKKKTLNNGAKMRRRVCAPIGGWCWAAGVSPASEPEPNWPLPERWLLVGRGDRPRLFPGFIAQCSVTETVQIATRFRGRNVAAAAAFFWFPSSTSSSSAPAALPVLPRCHHHFTRYFRFGRLFETSAPAPFSFQQQQKNKLFHLLTIPPRLTPHPPPPPIHLK